MKNAKPYEGQPLVLFPCIRPQRLKGSLLLRSTGLLSPNRGMVSTEKMIAMRLIVHEGTDSLHRGRLNRAIAPECSVRNRSFVLLPNRKLLDGGVSIHSYQKSLVFLSRKIPYLHVFATPFVSALLRTVSTSKGSSPLGASHHIISIVSTLSAQAGSCYEAMGSSFWDRTKKGPIH